MLTKHTNPCLRCGEYGDSSRELQCLLLGCILLFLALGQQESLRKQFCSWWVQCMQRKGVVKYCVLEIQKIVQCEIACVTKRIPKTVWNHIVKSNLCHDECGLNSRACSKWGEWSRNGGRLARCLSSSFPQFTKMNVAHTTPPHCEILWANSPVCTLTHHIHFVLDTPIQTCNCFHPALRTL